MGVPRAVNEYLSNNFNNLNLSGKEVCFSEFDGCTFIECDFSETLFKKCKFIDCCFVKCNLSVVKMEYSKFSDVIFDEWEIDNNLYVITTGKIDVVKHTTTERKATKKSSFWDWDIKKLVFAKIYHAKRKKR